MFEFDSESFQTHFHYRWNHLNDPHVRALAWLWDAPDLLDPFALEWQGRIASLKTLDDSYVLDWLSILDRSPDELHAHLGKQLPTRLGRYAEKLMAFYFQHQGILTAHGVQVQQEKNVTIGEFDFLLQQKDQLWHWEFASKFYLWGAEGAFPSVDYFIGPHLVDTLRKKMSKLLEQQLLLSQHPAAQIYLPKPISSAQALIKGWLFYKGDTFPSFSVPGVSSVHCRGFWCPLKEFRQIAADYCLCLPKLRWLAPAKAAKNECVKIKALYPFLQTQFVSNKTPVLIALMKPMGNHFLEFNRVFIVPDDWEQRAKERIAQMRGIKSTIVGRD